MSVPPPDSVPSVAVIVLNWNGTNDTLECLASLMHVDYPRCEIVVVDNGSRPSPRERIAQEFPTVSYVEAGLNLGYAGGNNVGIRYALARGHDYVFVLNNDTTVDAGFLKAAVAVAETDPRIAVVGIKILSFEDPSRVWVAYGKLIYRKGLVRLIGFDEANDGRFDTQRDVEWVAGTGFLLRRSALEQVGLFDEEFFAYHEDVDWCTAAREQGWRVVYAPSASIFHKGHRSTGGKGFVNPRQYMVARSTVLFVRKHARWYQWLRFYAFQVVSLPLAYLYRSFTGERRGVALKIRGTLDGLRRRPMPFEELGLR
jgi:GT2 family glycosyltransferase